MNDEEVRRGEVPPPYRATMSMAVDERCGRVGELVGFWLLLESESNNSGS